jgi:hypothetical protein
LPEWAFPFDHSAYTDAFHCHGWWKHDPLCMLRASVCIVEECQEAPSLAMLRSTTTVLSPVLRRWPDC